MNVIFSYKRFWQLTKTEIRINKMLFIRPILGLISVMFIAYFISSTFFGITEPCGQEIGNSENMSVTFDATDVEEDTNFALFLYVMIMVIPLGIYKNLYDKDKGVRYAMMPASQLEKVLSAISICAIIMPVVLIAVYWLALSVLRFIHPYKIVLDVNEFFQWIFYAIQIQSVLFLLIFWFKENKNMKIIITFATITFLLIGGSYYVSQHLPIDFIYNFSGLLNFLADYGRIILCIIFPLIPWIVSYNKFIRTQI